MLPPGSQGVPMCHLRHHQRPDSCSRRWYVFFNNCVLCGFMFCIVPSWAVEIAQQSAFYYFKLASPGGPHSAILLTRPWLICFVISPTVPQEPLTLAQVQQALERAEKQRTEAGGELDYTELGALLREKLRKFAAFNSIFSSVRTDPLDLLDILFCCSLISDGLSRVELLTLLCVDQCC